MTAIALSYTSPVLAGAALAEDYDDEEGKILGEDEEDMIEEGDEAEEEDEEDAM